MEHGEDLAGHIAFQAADDLFLGLALGQARGHVVPGWLVVAQSDDHDPVQRGVGLAVTAPVDSLGRLRGQTGAWLLLTMMGGSSRLAVGKVASCPASRCDLPCALSAL